MCNSSDSSTNSNACLTPGPPCCEMYSSRFASAARFTTTHLRNGGIVRAMCHNASIGVFGSLADCGVSARCRVQCARQPFCTAASTRRLRCRARCGMSAPCRSQRHAGTASRHAWPVCTGVGECVHNLFFLLSLLSSVRRCFRIASASRGPAADCADASIPRESAHSRPTRTRNAP